ncbi:MAG TPA: transglycosylase family protein [Amycolatopsis sp.]|uniref:LysM peptidoglycan-binding domain-containing protein n=1 Tax=Amycolatopsis sp. TaxID=37632 RepID=UPI002B48F737|nr:transglycosylase family protein [Amycolatopsis sp.]HKS49797.1 transglycosylase family protein [Amycolatopsis sp.]
MGRHSKPSKTKTILKRTGATAALAGAAVGGIGIIGAGTADAFPGQAGLVRCESGGNPAIVNNTPAGQRAGRPAGLFQIVTGTWLANGGGQFAPTADRATAAQQQIVADRIYAKQGAAPWECKPGSGPAQFANFGGATAPVAPAAPAPARAATPVAPAPARAAGPAAAPSPGGSYTVVAGDTLSGIAWKFHVAGGWVQLQKLNRVSNPDLILVGQKLAIK